MKLRGGGRRMPFDRLRQNAAMKKQAMESGPAAGGGLPSGPEVAPFAVGEAA